MTYQAVHNTIIFILMLKHQTYHQCDLPFTTDPNFLPTRIACLLADAIKLLQIVCYNTKQIELSKFRSTRVHLK